jgi:hypothetical protein
MRAISAFHFTMVGSGVSEWGRALPRPATQSVAVCSRPNAIMLARHSSGQFCFSDSGVVLPPGLPVSFDRAMRELSSVVLEMERQGKRLHALLRVGRLNTMSREESGDGLGCRPPEGEFYRLQCRASDQV